MNMEQCKILCIINMELGKYFRVSQYCYGYVCGGARLPGFNIASPFSSWVTCGKLPNFAGCLGFSIYKMIVIKGPDMIIK